MGEKKLGQFFEITTVIDWVSLPSFLSSSPKSTSLSFENPAPTSITGGIGTSASQQYPAHSGQSSEVL